MAPVSTYHHGNLRAALIEQGVELAREKGPEGVVLREVARRAGVSHNAAYRHFADREALLAEIAAVGMQRLGEAMRADMDAVTASDARTRARDRLRACGRAYVHFAVAEPGLFAVAFAAVAAAPPDDAGKVDDQGGEKVGGNVGRADPATDPYSILGRALDDLDEAGVLGPDRRDGAEVLCWAAVHGFSVLHLDGPLHGVPDADREAGLESLLDQVERGLV
jgi:AcrR family transcriptional regulator